MTVQRAAFSRPVMLHVCKDGTVSYRMPGEPVFNGVALPVFSGSDPAACRPDGLGLEDLDGIRDMFSSFAQQHLFGSGV